MRLPNGVLSVVRGVGGAAVIAIAGCGAMSTSTRDAVAEKPAEEVETAIVQPEEQFEPDETIVSQPDYDMAVACGRG